MKVEELRRIAGTLADVLPIHILSEADRQELASHMTLRKFKQDEVVYHQGDPAAHWFVVFEGLVKVLLLDENGRELLISLHSRGEFRRIHAEFLRPPSEDCLDRFRTERRSASGHA